ncbi:hypothetical protein KUTeg_018594 [Tegillarca granosa]|uniref:Glutaredoxin domain-containing protein n=1 Tax=Tegillarca granosa TaxID=220873 RepID=A0ABQ9EKW3_TEGGR|nr:hypothetical protein KUTeg_018594 [Tegillarca granosa]
MVNPKVKELVNKKIAGKKVMVFSKTTCGFCSMAKDTLSKYGLKPDDYEVIELNEVPDGQAIQIYLSELTHARTVKRKKEIEAKIRARKVVMFSVTTCRFCTQAKGILAKYSLSKDDYEVMELDKEEDGGDISRYLLLKTHKSSVCGEREGGGVQSKVN